MPPYVFFGSPLFARIILEKLVANGLIPAVLVCNPDKPFGRKQILTPPETKKFVIQNNLSIKIIQPETKEDLKNISDIPEIKESKFGVVAAYAKIIPQSLINAFPQGIIGTHPSLLPKYRGSSPIQNTILENDKITGATLYLLDEKMDHGPILAQESMDISDKGWNYNQLLEALADACANALIRTLPLFSENKIVPEMQDESKATYTKKFTTEDGFIDLKNEDPEMIARKIRALNPDPGTYTLMETKRVKLLDISKQPDGSFVITKIQPEGKTPQPAALKLSAK
jgi:methionyl-tRNA formyltransferase